MFNSPELQDMDIELRSRDQEAKKIKQYGCGEMLKTAYGGDCRGEE